MNEYLIKAFISKGGTVEELLEVISNSDTTFDDKVWQANQVKNMFEILNAETKEADTNSNKQPQTNGDENDKKLTTDNNNVGDGSDALSNNNSDVVVETKEEDNLEETTTDKYEERISKLEKMLESLDKKISKLDVLDNPQTNKEENKEPIKSNIGSM